MLDQLSPSLLRQIALHMVDPSGLAGAFLAAWRLIRDEAFVFEWFSRWQPIITPYRPWQYSIITWRQAPAAQPDAVQLASFMLRNLLWQQGQEELEQQRTRMEFVCLSSLGPNKWTPCRTTVTSSADSAPNNLQQTAGNPHAAAAGPKVLPRQQPPGQIVAMCGSVSEDIQLLRRSDPREGSIGSFPCCQPAPATVHKARKLLANGHGVAALMLLCPASGTLLLPYVSISGNRTLFRQIVEARRSGPQFPYCYLRYSKLWLQFPAVEMACYAALRARSPDTLMLLLASKQSACSYLAHRLLRYAAQHSNAACIEQLLLYVAATNTARLSPCHVAAAAARSDAEAAAVVDLVLGLLPVKQRTAKWLKATYAAACSSGSVEVMQVLLRHVAATADNKQQHRRHIVALLEACGETGNVWCWDWLLAGKQSQACSSASSSSKRGSSSSADDAGTADGRQPQREQQPSVVPLATAGLAPQQLVSILHALLPCRNLEYQNNKPADQQQKCINRLRMADQLWVLVQAAGQDTAVQQLVTVCPKPDTPLLPSAAALQILLLKITEQGDVAITNGMVLERLWWLQMHGLMLKGVVGGYVLRTVWYWVGDAFREAENAHALRLYLMWCECEAGFKAAQAAATVPSAEATAAAAAAGSGADVARGALDDPRELSTVASQQHVHAAEADPSEPTLTGNSDLKAAVQTLDAAAAVFDGAGPANSAAVPAAAAAAAAAAAIGALHQPAHNLHPAAAATTKQPLQPTPTAAPSLSSAPVPGTASSKSVTLEDISQQDLHHAADMLLSSRVAAAAAAGDLTSLQQIVGILLNGQLSSARETVFDASWLLPQWLCCKKLGEEAAAHSLSSQPGRSHEAVSSSTQHRNKEDLVATARSPTSVLSEAAGCKISSSENTISKPETSQQQQQLQQRGFRPLWQLALLKLLSGTSPQVIDLCLASIRHPKDLLMRGVGVQQLQGLADADLLGNAGFCHIGSTGVELAGAAIQQMQPSVLAWALLPQQRYLWSVPNRSGSSTPSHPWGRVVLYYGAAYCSPIDGRSRSHWCSLEKEEQELLLQHQHQHHLFKPPMSAAVAAAAPLLRGAAFLQSSTELALLMLQQPPPTDSNMLSLWISKFVGARSSNLVRARAKSILAAVAASKDIPWGAKVVQQSALKKVLAAGDVDLLAMLLMWAARLSVEQDPPHGAGGIGFDDDEGLFPDLLGALGALADGNGVPGLGAVLGLHADL